MVDEIQKKYKLQKTERVFTKTALQIWQAVTGFYPKHQLYIAHTKAKPMPKSKSNNIYNIDRATTIEKTRFKSPEVVIF
jgi:hypothetical protein